MLGARWGVRLLGRLLRRCSLGLSFALVLLEPPQLLSLGLRLQPGCLGGPFTPISTVLKDGRRAPANRTIGVLPLVVVRGWCILDHSRRRVLVGRLRVDVRDPDRHVEGAVVRDRPLAPAGMPPEAPITN